MQVAQGEPLRQSLPSPGQPTGCLFPVLSVSPSSCPPGMSPQAHCLTSLRWRPVHDDVADPQDLHGVEGLGRLHTVDSVMRLKAEMPPRAHTAGHQLPPDLAARGRQPGLTLS